MNKRPSSSSGSSPVPCLIPDPYPVSARAPRGRPVKVESHDEGAKELFVNNCGPCHTLAAAGTDGVVGPDLDDQLAPGGTGTFEGSYGRAIIAITCGYGGGRMPAGILQGENAKEVAAFVAAYAGQLSEDGPAGGHADGGEGRTAVHPLRVAAAGVGLSPRALRRDAGRVSATEMQARICYSPA